MKDPQLPDPWCGIWNATKETVPCWERDVFSGEIHGSEDCLYLNVFTRQVNFIFSPLTKKLNGFELIEIW